MYGCVVTPCLSRPLLGLPYTMLLRHTYLSVKHMDN